MSSILLVEGAGLTKRNGGGVRSRAVLETLRALGDVHVINLIATKRHIGRIDPIEGVASQNVVVAHSKDTRAAQTMIKTLITQNEDIKLLVLRYFNTWQASGIQEIDFPSDVSTWLDLDDRADRILFGKLQKSRFWVVRALAKPLSDRKKRAVETAARNNSLASLASNTDLGDFAPEANVICLANVVPDVPEKILSKRPSQSQSLLFIGTYSWPPNVQAIKWFIDHCWDNIVTEFPDVELHVVGTGKRSVRDSLAQKYQSKKRIVWHFDIPNLDAHYRDSRAVISPVQHGSGSKIKVIEAASFERPVVVTPHSARGLNDTMQKLLKIVETPEAFSDACCMYLREPEQADQDGAALLNAQKTYHSVESFKRAALSALSRANPSLPIPSERTLAPLLSNEVQQ